MVTLRALWEDAAEAGAARALARLGLAHWRIGEVVAARDDGRVRIG